MAYERYCYSCGKQVKCREERTENAIRLFCGECGHRIGSVFEHIVIT